MSLHLRTGHPWNVYLIIHQNYMLTQEISTTYNPPICMRTRYLYIYMGSPQRKQWIPLFLLDGSVNFWEIWEIPNIEILLKFNSSHMETFDDWKMLAFPFRRSTRSLTSKTTIPTGGVYDNEANPFLVTQLWPQTPTNPKRFFSWEGPNPSPNAIFFIPSLKLTISPKNGWLKDNPFLSGQALFSGCVCC